MHRQQSGLRGGALEHRTQELELEGVGEARQRPLAESEGLER